MLHVQLLLEGDLCYHHYTYKYWCIHVKVRDGYFMMTALYTIFHSFISCSLNAGGMKYVTLLFW